jgi:hypothetical protein
MDKGELLAKYAKRPVTKFIQYDGFLGEPGSGGMPIGTFDEDGDWLSGGRTEELMSGGPAVRVLVLPDAKAEDVIRILRKVSEWIQREGVLNFRQEGLPF